VLAELTKWDIESFQSWYSQAWPISENTLEASALPKSLPDFEAIDNEFDHHIDSLLFDLECEREPDLEGWFGHLHHLAQSQTYGTILLQSLHTIL
jgi:hypothetical protein